VPGADDDEQVTNGPVRDFDLHHDEDGVRVFVTEPGGESRAAWLRRNAT
jgi:hypothetical protein